MNSFADFRMIEKSHTISGVDWEVLSNFLVFFVQIADLTTFCIFFSFLLIIIPFFHSVKCFLFIFFNSQLILWKTCNFSGSILKVIYKI